MKFSWAGIFFLATLCFSCGTALTKRTVTSTSPETGEIRQELLVQRAESLKGLARIQENDCPSCHAVSRISVGPSYTAVAERYEATEEMIAILAQRIISGSVGSWGEIPMTAHLELTQEDAEQMVRFVFTLKN